MQKSKISLKHSRKLNPATEALHHPMCYQSFHKVRDEYYHNVHVQAQKSVDAFWSAPPNPPG